MTGNLQADGVQSRQTLFVRYCLKITHTAWFPFFGKHMRCVCCVSGECPLLHFPAKKPLTNAAFWRIIKVKREHTSRRSAPMLSYQEITVQVSSSGRLFPFMVMMIGKQNCCLNQSNLFQKESASQRANAACYFRASQNFKRKREDNRQPVCPLFYIVHISCPLSVRGFFVRYCL